MFLERFSLPQPDIRLITLDDTIYKIKLYLVKPPRHSRSHDQTGICSNNKNQEDIEHIIVALLTSSEDLQPIKTKNLVVYPYRKRWKIANKVLFYRNEKLLKSCPYVYSFYVEEKRHASEDEETNKKDREGESNSSENEDNESLSLLDGCKLSDVHSAEEMPETSKSPSDEKPDAHTEERETALPGPLDIALTKNQKRKRHHEIPSEEESKKKRYSVSEYTEKNRHDVQEQDLQEQLRLQELASPEDEKADSETKQTKFQRVVSSITAVKRLMFGPS